MTATAVISLYGPYFEGRGGVEGVTPFCTGRTSCRVYRCTLPICCVPSAHAVKGTLVLRFFGVKSIPESQADIRLVRCGQAYSVLS